MASWSREAILSFIDIYKSFECLWRIKSKDYSNRMLKDKAYEQLIEFVRQFDKTANRDTVTKKINSIRTAFRKEVKKFESSKTSGAGEEDVYMPKLWYFNELLFLRDQELPRSSISNIGMSVQPLPSSSQQNEEDTEINAEESLFDEDEDVDKTRESGACNIGPDLPPMSLPTPIARSSSRESDVSTKGSVSSKSRPGKRKAEDELLTLVHDCLKAPEGDEHDAFAKTVAFKMRKLSKMQCFIAEKIINDVLFAAGLEQLNTQSCFVAQSPQAPVDHFTYHTNEEVPVYRSYEHI